MCPLRLILVFLSASIAGYFAWKTLRSKGEEVEESPQSNADTSNENSDKLSFIKRIQGTVVSGFWTFVDMASGRYLWQNLVAQTHKVKES